MNMRELKGKDWLRGEDLKGKDVNLTIDRAVRILVSAKEEYWDEEAQKKKTRWEKEPAPVLYFREMVARNKADPLQPNMKMFLNSTNIDTISAMHGEDSKDWPEKRITLYPLPGTWFGEKREAIRVRSKAPAPV